MDEKPEEIKPFVVRRKKDPKLVVLLKSLNNKEMKALDRFVRSPYFNTSERLVALYEEIQPHHPDYPPESMDLKLLHKAVFGKMRFNTKDIQREMSRLAKLVEEFMGQQELRTDTPAMYTAKLSAYGKRGLADHFEKAKALAADFHSVHPLDPNSLYHRFRVTEEIERLEQSQAGGGYREPQFRKAMDHFDSFLVAVKLKYQCMLASYQQTFHLKDDPLLRFVPELIQELATMGSDNALVSLYRYAVLCSMEPENPEHFRKLKSNVIQSSDVSTRDRRLAYEVAQNYCANRVNAGQDGYVNELFDLYRFGFENEMLHSKKGLHPVVFINVVKTGVRAGQSEWVARFIDDASRLIPEPFHRQYAQYGLSLLQFEEGNFEEVKRLIDGIGAGSYFVTVWSRELFVRSCYELGQLDLAERENRNLYGYFVRNREANHDRIDREVDIRLMERLLKLNRNSATEVDTLYRDIQQVKVLPNRKWILAKLEEMRL